MSNLDKFKDETARAAFGITKAEAINRNVCINCKQPPKFYTEMGRKEYDISGLCEFCFDLICDPNQCQICNKPESFHIHKPGRGECEKFRPAPSSAVGD